MAVKTVQAVINGVATILTLDSNTGKYTATVTAPNTSSYNVNAGHYYAVTVNAMDEAGNTSEVTDTDPDLGDSLKIKVCEKVPPAIIIVAPTNEAYIINNKPQIRFKVTDNDSGVNPDSIKITIDSGAAVTDGITKTAITGGFECAYTPAAALSDGSHTIKVDAADFDKNAASQKSVTFKIDTVPPTLSVSAPVDNLVTNQVACVVTGTTNDITSSPCVVTVKLNNGEAEMAEVNNNGTFSKSLTLSEGSNTIMVVSMDSAGKSSTVTRTVVLDTVAPVIKSVSITPNPVDAGKTFVISVEVTD